MQLIKAISIILVAASAVICLINAILATSFFGVVFYLQGFIFGILALVIIFLPD
jgi:hypothetical protein